MALISLALGRLFPPCSAWEMASFLPPQPVNRLTAAAKSAAPVGNVRALVTSVFGCEGRQSSGRSIIFAPLITPKGKDGGSGLSG